MPAQQQPQEYAAPAESAQSQPQEYAAPEETLGLPQQTDIIRQCGEWAAKYPNIMKMAACPGVAKVFMPKLVKKAAVHPVTSVLQMSEDLPRTKSSIRNMVKDNLWPTLQKAKWTNPKLNDLIIESVASEVHSAIEAGIKDAEGDRCFMDILLRRDVFSKLHVKQQYHTAIQQHETFVTVEGFASSKRMKNFASHEVLALTMTMKFAVLTVDKDKMETWNDSKKMQAQLEDYDPAEDSD